MTVQEVQIAADAFSAAVTKLAREFEAKTGCIVHSLPVRPANVANGVTVDVKVQIAGA